MAERLRPGRTDADAEPTKGKRKKASKAAAPETAPVITLEQKYEAMARLIEAQKKVKATKAEADRAKSSYRSIYREALKITGFTEDQISWYMAERDTEPQVIDAVMRGRAEIAQFMELPVGFQKFFDFNAPAAADDDSDDAEEAHVSAFNRGRDAGDSDRPEACPYPAGSNRAAQWQRGYERRQAEIANEMRPRRPAAEAHA